MFRVKQMNRRQIIVSRLITGLLLALPAGAMAQNTDTPASSSTIKEWEALSKRGDAEAQFALAEAYKWGKGVKPDLKKAEMYYGKAAAQGHMQASDEYGLMLFDRGEKETAFPYVKAASDRGDARAQYLVAIAHFNGDLAPKDWVRAYALMSLAQTAGLPQASLALPKFDQFIPLAQRQQGVALSQQIATEAEATRNRQIASAGLGAAAVPPPPAPPPPAQILPRAVIPAPETAVAGAQQTANGANPRMAGADYARPAVIAPPLPSKPTPVIAVSAPPKPSAAAPSLPRPTVSTPSAASNGGWRVQIGAFSVSANADALWSKLRARPELSGHPRVSVTAGAVIKLQAGGFNEETARNTCGKLSAAGFTCVPVRN
jgi:cell division septation protein DedD